MAKGHFKRGTVEGDSGTAINIQLGFAPNVVFIMNIDGDSSMWWTSDMTDGEAYKSGADGAEAQLAASEGVTPYAGTSAANSVGFTIGTNTDVNQDNETMMWIAWGEE